MTHAIGSSILAEDFPRARVNLSTLPTWLVPRRRLADRLDLGVLGLLTTVTGATGWGKTLGVASWATNAQLPGGLIWLSLAGAGEDPDQFWTLLRQSLMEAGERHLAPIPAVGSANSRRVHALTVLGMAMGGSGPWTIVVDDYPTGSTGRLGRDIQVVLDHARRGVRLVVISRGDPALDLQRHHVAGELSQITAADLPMDSDEVAEVLARQGNDVSEITARVVERHTSGWPCGVRLAALALRGAPTIESALEEADRATVEYLAAEVLGVAAPPIRDLIIRTSFLDEVNPDLAGAVLGSDTAIDLDSTVAGDNFLELERDGSFRCHPLLRAAALEQLNHLPATATESRRRAAQWYVDRGSVSAGIALATTVEDWTWIGRTLVESYAVPRILAGSADDTVEGAVKLEAVLAAEPLLQASIALRHDHAAAANTVIAEMPALNGGSATAAGRLSAAFVRLAIARLGEESPEDKVACTLARELVAQLPAERYDELAPMLDGYEGSLQLHRGQLHDAARTLRHGVTPSTNTEVRSPAALDCQGRLALLEAFRGNLRVAEGHATAVLESAGTESVASSAQAHLAMAWVHVERAERAAARQQLDVALVASGHHREPWFETAHLLAEARLHTVTGQPEAALRMLVPASRTAQMSRPTRWVTDLLTIASAEALLSAGEPRRALDLLTPTPTHAPVEAAVLAASALLDLGDVDGAGAALAEVVAELPSAPLGFQIESWLLEAAFAQEAGRADHTHVVTDRALRTAGAETHRRPFAHRSAWLASLADRDPALRRTHGAFLAGLRPAVFRQPGRKPDPLASQPLLVETLTERESQVLGLLSEMCSTEEIARELFLSVNTVKTYVRGILRKLSVNRRVDAVRRGRDLGLC